MTKGIRTLSSVVIFLGLLLGWGLLTYAMASHRAVRGEFPTADLGTVALLIAAWWAPEETFNRGTPFLTIGTAGASSVPQSDEKQGHKATLRRRMLWTISSAGVWFLLSWLAGTEAHASFLDATGRHLLSYGLRSLAFILFLFSWIVLFPILPPSSSHAGTTMLSFYGHSRLWRVIAVGLGLTIGVYCAKGAELLLRVPELPGVRKFDIMQHWLVTITVALSVVLMARLFLRVPGAWAKIERGG